MRSQFRNSASEDLIFPVARAKLPLSPHRRECSSVVNVSAIVAKHSKLSSYREGSLQVAGDSRINTEGGLFYSRDNKPGMCFSLMMLLSLLLLYPIIKREIFFLLHLFLF